MAVPGLRRTLKLRHLILYGIIIIQPTAPMTHLRRGKHAARGHVVTAILIAMVAMLFTAVSYGRMARVYPSAGSAYTYVGKDCIPGLGYLSGWSIHGLHAQPHHLRHLVRAAAQNFLPQIPYLLVAGVRAGLHRRNLRGVRDLRARKRALALGMSIVVRGLFRPTVRYIALVARPSAADMAECLLRSGCFGPGRFPGERPLPSSPTLDLTASPPSEEVENPRRNILLATVLTCFVIGVLSAVEVYLAQLVWPGRVSVSARDG